MEHKPKKNIRLCLCLSLISSNVILDRRAHSYGKLLLTSRLDGAELTTTPASSTSAMAS